MINYIYRILNDVTDLLKGETPTLESNHLFEMEGVSVPLNKSYSKVYYKHTMYLLCLCHKYCPNLKLHVYLLMTRVRVPDTNAWKNLVNCIRYLQSTKYINLILKANKVLVIKCYIDAYFGVYSDI